MDKTTFITESSVAPKVKHRKLNRAPRPIFHWQAIGQWTMDTTIKVTERVLFYLILLLSTQWKNKKLWAMLFLTLATTPLFSQTMVLKESDIHWTAYAIGKFSQQSGNITGAKGFLKLSGKKITGKITLSTKSFYVTSLSGDQKGKLERKLKVDGFLEVEKHPTATIEILSATCTDVPRNKYEIAAKVTFKNMTRTESFPATVIVEENYTRITTEPLPLNRKDYRLRMRSSIEDKLLKNLFNISFDLSFYG